MKQFWQSVREILETVVIAAVTVFLIRAYLIQPFLVSGASMAPYIDHGNYLIIDELSPRFQDYRRGDVVVFRYPADPDTFYIKRIVAEPGDRVEIKMGEIWINDRKLIELYLPPDIRTFGNINTVLGADEYFVLGDNRDNSSDSRSWGSLKRKFIVGLARLRLFPFDQITIIERPAIN